MKASKKNLLASIRKYKKIVFPDTCKKCKRKKGDFQRVRKQGPGDLQGDFGSELRVKKNRVNLFHPI